MTRDDIMSMALEAGLGSGRGVIQITKFAALVAAAEREKFCSDLRALHDVYSLQSVSTIRAKGKE